MTNDSLSGESLVVKKSYFFPLLGTFGGSLRKMAKKIIPGVPTDKNV